ncbi:hypothetical protein F9K79_18400 [Ochrobactrum sp. Kaboul]|nr:hypothetical protein F9K79_18400 [Ochrobactrum sp. Kaboul]
MERSSSRSDMFLCWHYSHILRDAGLQRAISCAPVLTYVEVRSAPVLENPSFRHGLTNLQL